MQLCTCGCGACVEMSISAGSACVGVSFKFGWYTILASFYFLFASLQRNLHVKVLCKRIPLNS